MTPAEILEWFKSTQEVSDMRTRYRRIVDLIGDAADKRDYGLVDAVLEKVSPDHMPIIEMVVYLRTSYHCRCQLRNWFTAFHKTRTSMMMNDIDHKRSLAGLDAPPLKKY